MALETQAMFIHRIREEWPAGWHGRRFSTKDVGRRGKHVWITEALTVMPQSNLPEKVLSIERVRIERTKGSRAYSGGAQVGDREYRFSYFIRGRIGKAEDRWKWGQYAPLIPVKDLDKLLAKAGKEGTMLR